MEFPLSDTKAFLITEALSTVRFSCEVQIVTMTPIISHAVESVGITLNLKLSPCKHCYIR